MSRLATTLSNFYSGAKITMVRGRGAGNRPWTDYSSNRCTNGNCDRRFDYLKSVSTLLLENLSDMERAWREDGEITEQIYLADQTEMIERITKGVITFLNAELISERLRLPLRLQDPEHEHDCFSDQNTRQPLQ